MKQKLYRVSYKVKDKSMPDGFRYIGLADRSLLSLATSLKLKGFKRGTPFESNLSIIEACELLHNLFPPKKKKNPIEGLAFRTDFTELKCNINLNNKTIIDNTVCDLIDRNIELYPKGQNLDLYLSKTIYKELCEAFGGKVKKYKGHNIIVS